MNNCEALDLLFTRGAVDLRRGTLFDVTPPRIGVPWDRVEGMMLGLAVGDSLGVTTESMLPVERHRSFGEIRDYLPNRHVRTGSGLPVMGYPSDDSQLAFWTLEQMVDDRGLVPERVARKFTRDRVFGIGRSVLAALDGLRAGKAWFQCGQKSAGNGALMRIAPVLIPHLRSPSPALWSDTVLCALITHNDSASTAACLSFIRILWDLLGMAKAPEPGWWVSRFVETAADVETEKKYPPRGGAFIGWQGTLSDFVREKVGPALEHRLCVLDACNEWHSGAFLLETVPCALHILERHADDPEEAIVRAVNDTKDNDSIAAIVGAAIGALHGRGGLPERWISHLTGRTTDRDDGKMFEIMTQARELWDPAFHERTGE